MCFSLQRRAIIQHLNFKKWSEPVSFLTFWLWNVLLATAARNFCTSQLQKVVRTCSERRIFIENVLLATAACHFSCRLSTATSAPAALARLLWPSRHTKHWKTQHFATSLTFRACWSSFFPHLLIFFLAALLFQLSILSEVRLLNFLWWSTYVKQQRNKYVKLFVKSSRSSHDELTLSSSGCLFSFKRTRQGPCLIFKFVYIYIYQVPTKYQLRMTSPDSLR